MCAIAGIIGEDIYEDILTDMCNRMVRRGPDNMGVFIDGNVGLGHRRLSIVDVATGDQPMFSSDRSVVMVFNGEIYNFIEIKTELIALGRLFITNSDTEVILEGYRQYGIDGILSKLEGMFAFALYDKETKEVYIARDKFGEKPLYYSDDKGQFMFASELKAFAPNLLKYTLDKKALNYFLSLSYIPAPYTIYNEIRKLEQGTYIHIVGGSKHFCKYYDLKKNVSNIPICTNFEDAKCLLVEKMTESVRKRMIADVPIGAFLSGGIDSSIVCILMSKLSKVPINTFSIGFKEKDYDESNRARLVAKYIKSNHHEYILDYNDVLNILDDIILYCDEPFGDSSIIPSFYVAKLAREQVKVVLTGDCADEIFAGYDKYLGRYYIDKYKKLPFWLQNAIEKFVNYIPYNSYTSILLRKIKKVILNSSNNDFDIYYDLMCLGVKDSGRKNLLLSEYYIDVKSELYARYMKFSGSKLKQEQLSDIQTVLEGDMFTKVDRACMFNSLENRAPFIDSGICEFAFNIPDNYRLNCKNKKYILKEAFRSVLPKNTLKFPKRGFGVPVDYWFRNELKKDLETLLEKENIIKQGIFNYMELHKVFMDHVSGKENNKGILWNIFVFQKWYEKQI